MSLERTEFISHLLLMEEKKKLNFTRLDAELKISAVFFLQSLGGDVTVQHESQLMHEAVSHCGI